MPRLNYPTLPLSIIKDIKSNSYILVSENGYTYHKVDDFWRIYRLKDKTKYTFNLKKDAERIKKEQSKIIAQKHF